MANVSSEIVDALEQLAGDVVMADTADAGELNFDNLYPVLLQTFVVIVLG